MVRVPDPDTLTTEAQLELITHTAENAVKRFDKRRRHAARAGYLILLLGVIAAIWVSTHDAAANRDAIVQSGTVVAVEGCNRDFKTIGVLRAQVLKSKHQARLFYKEGTLTLPQLERTLAQTDRFLKRYPQPDCRVAASVLTSDAENVPPVPTPLHAVKDGG